MKRGFVFKTNKGNYYFYNDKTGLVDKIRDKQEEIYYGTEQYEHKVLHKKEINAMLEKNVTKQLILNVTEDCNMRCKYCVYSGNYTNNRVHSKAYMREETAIKAVAKYLQCFEKQRKYDISSQPIVSFFGGEPLLNFNLIKYVVDYIKSNYLGNVVFAITTNGTLLREDIIDFLVRNKFDLTISLNGDKEENDRLRVFENGKGTYDIIKEKLFYLYKNYLDYYKEKVYFSVVYDTGTNLLELEAFFATNELVENKLSSFSEVVSSFTDWYDQYTEEDKIKFVQRRNELKKKFLDEIYCGVSLNPVIKKMFADMYVLILNRRFGEAMKENKILPYTGACMPGTKVNVGYDGNLYLCEKVNCANPIGDVDGWFNAEKIKDLLNDYNKVGEKCINCPIRSLCPLCYRILMDGNGKLDKTQLKNCKKLIQQFIVGFKSIYSIMEDGKDIYKLFFNKE